MPRLWRKSVWSACIAHLDAFEHFLATHRVGVDKAAAGCWATVAVAVMWFGADEGLWSSMFVWLTVCA